MNWTHPHYEEIKMDAEIGSYQVDPDLPERFAAPPPGAPEEGELTP